MGQVKFIFKCIKCGAWFEVVGKIDELPTEQQCSECNGLMYRTVEITKWIEAELAQ